MCKAHSVAVSAMVEWLIKKNLEREDLELLEMADAQAAAKDGEQ